MECLDCHGAVEHSKTLKDIPEIHPSNCWECHEGRNFRQAQGYKLADSSFFIRKPMWPGELKFSHQLHMEKGMTCQQCHGDISRNNVIESPTPNMALCMKCHIKERAGVGCRVCHRKDLKPLNHQNAFWIQKSGHGSDGAMHPEKCRLCHFRTDFCGNCHMGNDYRDVHPVHYRFTHGTDVRFKRSNCAVCHIPVKRFCADCHENRGK